MTDFELIFSMLGEAPITAIVKTQKPKGFTENKIVAKQALVSESLKDVFISLWSFFPIRFHFPTYSIL